MPLSEPFEYLSFGATFSRTFAVMVEHLDVFFSLSLLTLIPFAVIMITAGVFSASLVEKVPDFHPTHIPLVVLVFTIQILAFVFTTIVGRGAIIRATALMYIGQRPTWLACARSAWQKTWVMLGGSFIIYGAGMVALMVPLILISVASIKPNALTILLAVLAWVALLVGGVYGYLGVVMTNAAIMVENFPTPMRGIQRSWELAAGSRCYLLCTLFCLWFANNLISRLLHNVFVTGNVMDVLFSVAGIVVSILPMIVFFPMHVM